MRTTIIEMYDSEPVFGIERGGERGDVVLTINADGCAIRLNVGNILDSAESLHQELSTTTDKLAGDIIEGWQDTPDSETDGWISESYRDGFYVSLEGVQVTPGPIPSRKGFVSRDIAAYHLAKAMADGGVFPNSWYQSERGDTDDINVVIRGYHDEGGDKMLPLEGVEYEDGDLITWNGEGGYVVDHDYGKYGVVVYRYYDHDDRNHVTDRASLAREGEDDDESEE